MPFWSCTGREKIRCLNLVLLSNFCCLFAGFALFQRWMVSESIMRIFFASDVRNWSKRWESIKLILLFLQKFCIKALVSKNFMKIFWTFRIDGAKNSARFFQIRFILNLIKFFPYKTSNIIAYFCIFGLKVTFHYTVNSVRSLIKAI